ncbi:SMC-Scp complex subunit ScpB [Candidatus Gracilibacteria bacterium]|nr:SMC-Scp complex subunit ScpB [Candidatus Gracilibacteria bacterium]MCF7898422.1 SMC-Scp complex subunit ScpB [Candidatus Paceibacterota bacterium]
MLQKLVTILYLSGDPLPIATIANILGTTTDDVEKHIDELGVALANVGLSILRNKDELSIVTQAIQSELVDTFWKEELKGDLTPATLQVLTLVAYLGNGTREQISYIRGVQSSQSIRTLLVRGLIIRNGEVCTLTTDALKHLGITKVEDLPDYQKIHSELIEKLETTEA